MAEKRSTKSQSIKRTASPMPQRKPATAKLRRPGVESLGTVVVVADNDGTERWQQAEQWGREVLDLVEQIRVFGDVLGQRTSGNHASVTKSLQRHVDDIRKELLRIGRVPQCLELVLEHIAEAIKGDVRPLGLSLRQANTALRVSNIDELCHLLDRAVAPLVDVELTTSAPASEQPRRADIPKCPREDWPSDPMTRDLIIALKAGTARGETVENINRDFMGERKPGQSVMTSLKRAARRHRGLWDKSAIADK